MQLKSKPRRKVLQENSNPAHLHTTSTVKPRLQRFSSICRTQLNSINNSRSVSPQFSAVPLSLVSPCSVNISNKLQEELKKRGKTRENSIEKDPNLFVRALHWKKEKQIKIAYLQGEKEKKELEGCTFTPKVNRSTNSTRRRSVQPVTLRSFNFSSYSKCLAVRETKENMKEQDLEAKRAEEDREIEKRYLKITKNLDLILGQIQDSLDKS